MLARRAGNDRSPSGYRSLIYSSISQVVLAELPGRVTLHFQHIRNRRSPIGNSLWRPRHADCEKTGAERMLTEDERRAATSLYTETELEALTRWAARVGEAINVFASVGTGTYKDVGYLRHLDGSATWRLRKAIDQALGSAKRRGTPRLQAFARCAILRTAQWALDGRKKLPTINDFRDTLFKNAKAMIEGSRDLRETVVKGGCQPSTVHCLNRTTDGLETDKVFAAGRKPKLVVTSPPYPGVHVLYHRWQVDGRAGRPDRGQAKRAMRMKCRRCASNRGHRESSAQRARPA